MDIPAARCRSGPSISQPSRSSRIAARAGARGAPPWSAGESAGRRRLPRPVAPEHVEHRRAAHQRARAAAASALQGAGAPACARAALQQRHGHHGDGGHGERRGEQHEGRASGRACPLPRGRSSCRRAAPRAAAARAHRPAPRSAAARPERSHNQAVRACEARPEQDEIAVAGHHEGAHLRRRDLPASSMSRTSRRRSAASSTGESASDLVLTLHAAQLVREREVARLQRRVSASRVGSTAQGAASCDGQRTASAPTALTRRTASHDPAVAWRGHARQDLARPDVVRQGADVPCRRRCPGGLTRKRLGRPVHAPVDRRAPDVIDRDHLRRGCRAASSQARASPSSSFQSRPMSGTHARAAAPRGASRARRGTRRTRCPTR